MAGPLVTMYPSLRHGLLLVASKGRRGVNSCPSLPDLDTCRQSRVPEGCRLAATGLRPASLRGTPPAGGSALPVGRPGVEAFACVGMSRIPKWLESSLTSRPAVVWVPWSMVGSCAGPGGDPGAVRENCRVLLVHPLHGRLGGRHVGSPGASSQVHGCKDAHQVVRALGGFH